MRATPDRLRPLDAAQAGHPPCIRDVLYAARIANLLSEDLLLVPATASVIPLPHQLNALRRAGYAVLEAATGHAALEAWATHAGRIDLLLTDVLMPEGMTGWTLAETLSASQPALKVICMSGYSADMAGHQFIVADESRFLQKPFLLEQLLQKVRACLDYQTPPVSPHN